MRSWVVGSLIPIMSKTVFRYYETSLLPDHWKKKVMAMMMFIRLRLSRVLKRDDQPTVAAMFLPASMAVLISVNSYWTRASCLENNSK